MKVAVVRTVVFLGVVYFVVGVVFGAFAGRAASNQGRVAWRWAAWALSGAVFGALALVRRGFAGFEDGVSAGRGSPKGRRG